jgi:hypothetical protein
MLNAVVRKNQAGSSEACDRMRAGKPPYSINTPLTTSNFKIRASPAFQKTTINTVDVYVFYFQFSSISQAGRRGFDPRLPLFESRAYPQTHPCSFY